MGALHQTLRRELAKRAMDAHEVAEQGAEAALTRLAVADREPHGHLTPEERVLRNRLRARARALGDTFRPNGVQELDHLVEEVAYEAWHRMLFARFLAENGLLVHPEHGVPVTLAECEELAPEEGAEDQWVLASRYAARMLPQIFRPDDPALQVVFAPEHRAGLERLLEELAPEVFRADDSLGWVYQFWQAKKKDEVNAAGEPITGETLPAVTQLFTEPYMVSFLLENTIGAWWAGRHPGETPPVEMPYLRRLEDGTPAAGTFEGWPKNWREFTLLDPCCGSGHFLVAALRLIVPLRMYDEGLDAASAVDATLRENLYGLELDARCTQIAAFAVALAAWTTSEATGYRPLPELQIACSGLAVAAEREEWVALAEGDHRLGAALGQLHDRFKLAPELGSLIDPASKRADLLTASFSDVTQLLERALAAERGRHDEQFEASAVTAQGVARAASLLARKFVLIATNVPYLGRQRQSAILKSFADDEYPRAKPDLASMFIERSASSLMPHGTLAVVSPTLWQFLKSYKRFRTWLLEGTSLNVLAQLGPGAFGEIGGAVVNVGLLVCTRSKANPAHTFFGVDATPRATPSEKAKTLQYGSIIQVGHAAQQENPDQRILLSVESGRACLGDYASVFEGLHTGDHVRFGRAFWELLRIDGGWVRQLSGPEGEGSFQGREHVLFWENGTGALIDAVRDRLGGQSLSMWIKGQEAWGRQGVAVSSMSGLRPTFYLGELFTHGVYAIVPNLPEHHLAIAAFCSSPEFNAAVRRLDMKLAVARASVAAVAFDVTRWEQEASVRFPDGLPTPISTDPTQWLYRGQIPLCDAPLQASVALLLGYKWPEQHPDSFLDSFADTDGIVCLPAVRGEHPAADRLQVLLSSAFGAEWSPRTREHLLVDVSFAGKSLDQWLREGFFEQHCKLFHQRPFIWHIWDGLKDGFSALVNYHKLSRATLETLTYTYLGDWIARQEEARKRDERGADVRLAKAKELQQKLQLIIEGEPPYDLFVRWKAPHEQPIGWDPDLNDGVRVNIWPFVQAGVLRSKVNVNWKKDRGKNPPGSPWGEERHNRYEDIPRDQRPASLRNVDHLTNEVRRRLREEAAAESISGSALRAKAVRK